MKLLLATLALFTLAITALHAADPVVLVLNETTVTVNGQNWGKPCDVIANNPQLAPAVQLALEKWAADLRQAKADADAALAAKNARINTVLQSKLTDELKTGEGPKTQLLRTLMSEAAKTEQQLKAEALEAEIAAKQAELQKLTAD